MSVPLPIVVILAGGAGRRMGGNKPFHVYEGRPLIDAVIARLIPQCGRMFINSGADGHAQKAALSATGIPLRGDDPRFAGLGPLSGVHSALQTAAAFGETIVVTAPCDMPNLPADMVGRLIESRDESTDISHFVGARDYPLCALWNVNILPSLENALDAARVRGGLPVMAWLARCRVKTIPVTDDLSFTNINRPGGGPSAA